MKTHHVLSLMLIFLLSLTDAHAQFKKLLQKAEQKAENALDKKVSGNAPNATGTTTGANGGSTAPGSTNGNPSNNGGGGLISTPPDVKQNLTDAETAYKGKNYSEARYAVQQAMLGVELEIGNQILKSLPASLNGLDKLATADQVASSGAGWAGLVIARKYSDGKNKQFNLTIANNSAWMSALNVFMNSGGYAQQTGGQQNWKQTKLNGYKAIIEFNQGSGYKLSVPIGQSSLIVFEGISFATEQEMMTTSGAIDIEGIKKQLGDQ